MSLADEKIKALRDEVYKDYEFWLGAYQHDGAEQLSGNTWKSGIIHAYRNVLASMDGEINKHFCPCHVCKALDPTRKENE